MISSNQNKCSPKYKNFPIRIKKYYKRRKDKSQVKSIVKKTEVLYNKNWTLYGGVIGFDSNLAVPVASSGFSYDPLKKTRN